MKTFFLATVAALLGIAACQSLKSTTDHMPFSGPSQVNVEAFQACTSALMVEGEPVVTGDSLFLKVSFAGGCGDHNFSLISNGMLKKSLPPQLEVKLCDKTDDSCEQLQTRDLVFDLSPFAPKGGGPVKLNLHADRDFTVLYVSNTNTH